MSDLGQETRGQPQSAPPPPAAPGVAAPASAGPAVTALGTGKGDARSLATLFSGLSDPKTSTPLQGDKRSEGKFPSWTSQNWRSLGGSVVGNRLTDTPQLDPKKPELPAKIKNATIGGPPVGSVDLTGLKVESSNKGDAGFYHDSTSGALALAKPGGYKYNKDGESADLYTARAVAGTREQVGVRANAKAAGRYGEAKAGVDAFALAEAGADASASFGSNGLQGSANTSARAGVGVKGDADLKSAPLLNIEGVDPVTAGIGTHADGFAGGRIGAGVKAGISPKFTGFESKLGGFAAAEGNVDAHASLGPLRAKIGASGFAGIGAEVSGGISLEDWKLHAGGRIGAALGLGGALSFDGSIDLKQAAQLDLALLKQLTPANQAKVLSGALTSGADLAKGGWGGVKEFLDPQHANHFSLHGLGVRAGRIGDGLVGVAHDTEHWASDKLHGAGQALSNAKDFAGGKLHDAGQALGSAKDWAGAKLHDAGQAAQFAIAHPGQALSNAKDWAGAKLHDAGQALGSARDWTGARLHEATDWAGDKLHGAGQALGSAKDWAGAKLHDTGAAAKYAVTHPGETLNDAKDWAGDKLHSAGAALSGATDWAGGKFHDADQALVGAKDWAGAKLHDAGAAAKYAVTHPGETLNDAKDWAGDKIHSAGAALNGATGWVGGKLSAAGRGLSTARDTVVSAAPTIYDGVKENFKQAGTTIASGARSAWSSLKGSGSDIKHFFGF